MALDSTRADRYRAMADELRVTASMVTLWDTRCSLLAVAAAYDRMAAIVEADEPIKQPPRLRLVGA
jgi:hypothetical protein